MLFRILFLFVFFVFSNAFVFANELSLDTKNSIKTRIDDIGVNLLNHNKITKRIVFVYNDTEKKNVLDIIENLTKRQVIVYDELYKSAQSDDEIAAMLAREISTVVKSYDGTWGGRIDSIQIAASPKKFEKVADKRAVDYMVKAGYNPLALIVYINKTCPQKRSDLISRTNLTSKRLAYIYEYLTFKYPNYLENNEYINNKYYQNFLLISVDNRSKLREKIKTKSTKEIKYE